MEKPLRIEWRRLQPVGIRAQIGRWLTRTGATAFSKRLVFQPIGTEGWYIKGQRRALYDQQAVDATSLICSAKAAASIVGDEGYDEMAESALQWFLGRNTLGEALYDPVSGGCFDGLHEGRINLNQGAESIPPP